MTAEPVRARHWPALDGMRALAVVGVMISHFQYHHLFQLGRLGVDVFFVLSGFLITSILIKSCSEERSVDFRDFYRRRVLRLFPALGAVLVFVIVCSPLIKDGYQRHQTYLAIPLVLLFVGNWDRALVNAGSMGALAHTWSLAVEEQFYIVWPLAFLWIKRHRWTNEQLAAGLAGLAVAVMAYREIAFRIGWSQARISNGTDTHCDGLILGCAVAFWVASGRVPTVGRKVNTMLAGGSLAVIVALMAGGYATDGWLEIGYPTAVILSGVLVLEAVTQQPTVIVNLLDTSLPKWIGQRSYGLYLWHFPIFLIGASQLGSGFWQHVGLFFLSFGVAALSFRFVEQPFLVKRNSVLQRASVAS
jgi:peptidoglycan/LPS O-acetylase OafA/YrhL